MRRLVLIAFILGAGILLQWTLSRLGDIEPPTLDHEQWWGVGEKPRDFSAYIQRTASSLQNMQVKYDKKIIIAELDEQLNRTASRLPTPLDGIAFEYGFNSRYLQKLIEYWRVDYLPRWQERERLLNAYKHYTIEIQGLRMHFLHIRSNEYAQQQQQSRSGSESGSGSDKQHYALLLLHGWPSSVREYYALIEKFTRNESKYVFDLIVPSLPGYGWSQGAARPGMGSAQMAVLMRNLMLRLGYQQFFVHGGDIGSTIGSNLATLFPEHVLGYHTNMCNAWGPKALFKGYIASWFPKLFAPAGFEDFFFSETKSFTFLIEESGYFHLQATKPDTIGIALTANPIGLAAYILEKYSTWTNADYRKLPDGGLTKRFDLDTLLDNVMIYYLTNSITTSQRWYAENYSRAQRALELERVPTYVPTGCARFKHEIRHSFDYQLKDKYRNIVHSTYYREGGHFAAAEMPDVVFRDFVEFVKKVEKFQQKLANN